MKRATGWMNEKETSVLHFTLYGQEHWIFLWWMDERGSVRAPLLHTSHSLRLPANEQIIFCRLFHSLYFHSRLPARNLRSLFVCESLMIPLKRRRIRGEKNVQEKQRRKETHVRMSLFVLSRASLHRQMIIMLMNDFVFQAAAGAHGTAKETVN